MQISPALLRYPSVPLPLFFNPFIPAEWRRGGEHSCFPVGLSCVRGWGQGRGTSVSAAVAAVALIRDWPSKPVSCIVHQRRSASQPESQMIPSTCKGKKNLPTSSFSHHPLTLHLLHACKSYITRVTNLRDTLFHWEDWEKDILWVPFWLGLSG